MCGHLEKLLKANNEGKGYFVGDKVSASNVIMCCRSSCPKLLGDTMYFAIIIVIIIIIIIIIID